MKKRINLVLREPVKLHETNLGQQQLETKPVQARERETKELSTTPIEAALESIEKANDSLNPTKAAEIPAFRLQSVPKNEPIADNSRILEKMPPRVRQIWGYFCEIANADGQLKDSFTVTRSEVMKSAGIGSTNTYRDALRKFQDLGLIRIELRPGVNAGSLFYLTELGIEIAETNNG